MIWDCADSVDGTCQHASINRLLATENDWIRSAEPINYPGCGY